ncbi:hypothetical protein Mapa_015686 [Marchantia paleacea]|nr:hypothetical protein Mapa_015686 [Marchantia paleacea]
MDPVKSFEERSRDSKREMFPRLEGMEPESLFDVRFKYLRPVRSPTTDGMGPVKSLCDTSKEVTEERM